MRTMGMSWKQQREVEDVEVKSMVENEAAAELRLVDPQSHFPLAGDTHHHKTAGLGTVEVSEMQSSKCCHEDGTKLPGLSTVL